MRSCEAKAREIITDNKDKVTLIAETLLVQETLTNEEVISLVNNGHLPVKEEYKKEVINTSVIKPVEEVKTEVKKEDKQEEVKENNDQNAAK